MVNALLEPFTTFVVSGLIVPPLDWVTVIVCLFTVSVALNLYGLSIVPSPPINTILGFNVTSGLTAYATVFSVVENNFLYSNAFATAPLALT